MLALNPIKRAIPQSVRNILRTLYHFSIHAPKYICWAVLRAKRWMLKTPVEWPVVGMHTVFLAKENILFLKEWILYHRLKGVTYFFLYDNTGVTQSVHTRDSEITILGQVSKEGVPYGDLVTLSDSEIQDVLDDIQREIPNVFVTKWQPRDADGQVLYAQREAAEEVLTKYAHLVDWMLFMDMDEFLVSDKPIPDMCAELEAMEYDGGILYEQLMPARMDYPDRCVTEIDRKWIQHGWKTRVTKYMCNVRRVTYAGVHNFHSVSRAFDYKMDRACYLHYKRPSRHPDVQKRFTDAANPYSPELLNNIKGLLDGETGGPAWKLSNTRADWKQVMETVHPLGC